MLSQDQIKHRIFEYVAKHPGCSQVELAVKSNVIELEGHTLDIPRMLEEWVDVNELTEVQYVLPEFVDFPISKSMYFVTDNILNISVTPDGVTIIANGIVVKSLPPHTTVECCRAKQVRSYPEQLQDAKN